ncbi:MAG: hypothetical protein KGR46_09945 [Verrucomicrobia bacterium]|nr:hypothetical protein [Verrucomicrobiota bacterium]
MKKITTLLTIGAAAIGIQSASANLIINGNFESGDDTGISSDYFFRFFGPDAGAGQYTVVNRLQDFHRGIAALGSLSGFGGSGFYYAANGASSTEQSPWYQIINNPSITLTTDTNSPVYYRFEARVANTVPYPAYAPPNLAFEIQVDGGAWNTFTETPLLSQQNQWILTYADTYLVNTPTSLGFRLRNLATAASGNDFALDNIYFGETTLSPSYLAGTTAIRSAGDIENPSNLASAVPAPGQIAASLVLLAGIGGYVFLKRRKAVKAGVTAAA